MKKRYAVQCVKHGMESKDWSGKQVLVPAPMNKKQRNNGGCPFCRKEAEQAAAAA